MDSDWFKRDAKTLVDSMFDCKLFKDSITRDDMQAYEDLITFLLESKFNSYIKIQKINDKINGQS